VAQELGKDRCDSASEGGEKGGETEEGSRERDWGAKKKPFAALKNSELGAGAHVTIKLVLKRLLETRMPKDNGE